MNQMQVPTTIVPIISFFAGLLAGKGVFGLDEATWATLIGAVVAAALTIYGAISSRKSALVSTVAAMPEVKSVTLDATAPASASLSASTPDNVKVG